MDFAVGDAVAALELGVGTDVDDAQLADVAIRVAHPHVLIAAIVAP